MPGYFVQVHPKGRFGEKISFELHLKKWHEKTQKPLWFLGFPNRYLFRFAMLVRRTDLDINYSKEIVFAHSIILELYSATFSVRVANCTNQNASFDL